MTNIFDDYNAFKKENSLLIRNLVETKSQIISRISSIIIVVDYLSERRIHKKLNQDEEYIFMIGYDYVYESFNTISIILKEYFDNDFNQMNKYARTINLLLYLNEYKNEAIARKELSIYLNQFESIESHIYDTLKNKEELDDAYFGLVDDLIYKAFILNGIDNPSIESIFYEISLEYNLDTDTDESMYLKILNTLIEEKR